MQVCPFILYPNAKRREAGLEPEQTLKESNKKRKIKIKEENPGEYYLVVVKDFTYHHDKQVMTLTEDQVVERQHWIEGVRQKSHPVPIVPWNKLPESYRRKIKAIKLKQKKV